MSTAGRLKSWGGGFLSTNPTTDVASGGTITIGINETMIYLTSAGSYTTASGQVFVTRDGIQPKREVRLVNTNASATITLKKTSYASSTEGCFIADFDIALLPGDVLTIAQLTNGAWVRIALAQNN